MFLKALQLANENPLQGLFYPKKMLSISKAEDYRTKP